MGLGINAANNPALRDYQLVKEIGLQFIEDTSDENTINFFKSEFGRWIVSNGIRELIETFSAFLDEVNHACLIIAVGTGQIPSNRFSPLDKRFRHSGLNDKISLLKDAFSVSTNKPEYLLSINQARHCLTHRRGIVGSEDCLLENKLSVKWVGIDVFAQKPSGDKVPLIPFPEEGVILEAGGKIMAAPCEREMVFSLGSLITFSPRDLAEFCLFVLQLTDEVIHKTEEYAKTRGIPLSTPKTVQDESGPVIHN